MQENGPYLKGSRAGHEFEQLRIEVLQSGIDVHLAIMALGKGFMTQARISFTHSYFATVGMRCHENIADSKVLVLCGSDEDYGDNIIPQIKALKKEGKLLVLAGNPVNKN
jgi:hypothetical protein